MSTMADPPAPRPSAAQSSSSMRHPARAWIVLCAVLAVVAVGLGVWALSLRSDLDSQKQKTAQAQQAAQEAQNDVGALSKQVDALVASLSAAGAELSNTGQDARAAAEKVVNDAKTTAQSLRGELRQAKSKVSDALEGK